MKKLIQYFLIIYGFSYSQVLIPTLYKMKDFAFEMEAFLEPFEKPIFISFLVLEMALACPKHTMWSNDGFYVCNEGFFKAFRKTCFYRLSCFRNGPGRDDPENVIKRMALFQMRASLFRI